MFSLVSMLNIFRVFIIILYQYTVKRGSVAPNGQNYPGAYLPQDEIINRYINLIKMVLFRLLIQRVFKSIISLCIQNRMRHLDREGYELHLKSCRKKPCLAF